MKDSNIRNDQYLNEESGDLKSMCDEFVDVSEPLVESISEDIKKFMKIQKQRMVPSASAMISAHNSQIKPDVILEHNDVHRIEWTETNATPDILTGESALRLPSLSLPISRVTLTANEETHSNKFTGADKNGLENDFKAFWPIKHGMLNVDDYTSLRACLEDIECIWTRALENDLGIPRAQFVNLNVMLVIPDMFHQRTVKEFIRLLLENMKFRAIIIHQESVCATFGAGVSSACVVDIGAQKISVSCVEEGVCMSDSRICLRYGGDDITAFMTSLLMKNNFPYSEIQIRNRQNDWELAETLKEKYCHLRK
ncbi:actin-like protein arp8, partial [Nowakowskiella sp. JEL0078]